jgi:hypothetical protein
MNQQKEGSAPRAGPVACPFCEGTDNELFSVFGQTLIGSQYYCHHCHTVFEAVRWEDDPIDHEEREDDAHRL